MNRKKKFDCVQMKWDIQAQIAKEYKNMPEEQAHRLQAEEIARDPILGPVLKRVPPRPAVQHLKKAS